MGGRTITRDSEILLGDDCHDFDTIVTGLHGTHRHGQLVPFDQSLDAGIGRSGKQLLDERRLIRR